MRSTALWTIALASAASIVAACTQSYDDFPFSDGTSSTGTPTATASGTGTATGTGTASSTGTATGIGGQGGAGASGGSASTGGGGGGSIDPTVLCDGAACDVSSGGYCCRDRLGSGTATCESSGDGCDANFTTIYCDGPEDCAGQVCCGVYQYGSYSVLECVDDCSGYNHLTFCDPTAADPCPADGDTCQESGALPGYYNCR